MRALLKFRTLVAAVATLALLVGMQTAGTASAKPSASAASASHAAKPKPKKHKKKKPKPKPKPKPPVPKPPPPPPPPNPNPSFSVEVVSTFTRHHVEHTSSGAPDENGCVFHKDSDANEVITTDVSPQTLTYNELLAGVSPFAVLDAEATIGGYYTYGYQSGCPYLTRNPQYVSDTSACGTEDFRVVADASKIGFIPGTNEFQFGYVYYSTDPFDGGCVHDVFAGDDLGLPSALSVIAPPNGWQTWTTVDPASLLSGKPVVIKYDQSGMTGTFDTVGDAYTFSWTVTLTPVDATS